MASKTIVSTTIASLGTPFTPLDREGSIYNITLDELQNSLNESGKNFGSMSMDEFLKNMSASEEGYTLQGSVHTESDPDRLFRSNLQQGSLILPRTLSRKNVDEVWREIQGHKEQERNEKQQQYQLQEQQRHHKNQQQQQQGPGNVKEMTLEDFLVKTGIVRDAAERGPPESTATGTSFGSTFGAALQTPQADVENITHNHQQVEWYKYQFNQQQQKQHQLLLRQQAEAAAAAIAGTAKMTAPAGGMLLCGNVLEAPLEIAPLLTNKPLSPGITTPFDVVERTVERRQRRMIKNRESAARSRARKLAYTVELEAEVMQLKEENLRLKRQRVAITSTATQQLKGPARVLRRTQSAPW